MTNVTRLPGPSERRGPEVRAELWDGERAADAAKGNDRD
jgi:hypothetical protein